MVQTTTAEASLPGRQLSAPARREAGDNWSPGRLAGEKAFAPTAAAVALLPLSIGSVLNDGLDKGASLPLSAYAALGALVVSFVFFVVAGGIVQRVWPEATNPRFVAVLVVYASTEILRTNMVALLLLRYAVEVDLVWPHRLLAGGLTGMAVIGVAAIVLNDRAHYVAQYRQLVFRRQELERELDNLNQNIGAFIDQLRDSVREAVDAALNPIVDDARKRHSAREIVEDIVRVSEDVVRPLSHQVSAALPADTQSVPRTRPPRVSFARLVQLTTTVAPFQPRVVSLIVFMLLFSASVFLLAFPVGALFLVSALTVGFVTHWFGQRYVQPRLPSWSLWLRVVVISAVYPAGFLITVLGLIAFREQGITVDRVSGLGYPLLIIEFLSWGLATIPAIRAGQREILEEGVETTSELAQIRARAEVRLRREKQRLAATVHGDVQSILMAAALRLQHPDTTREDALSIVSEARAAIARTLDEARMAETVWPGLEELCQRLVDSWSGVVEISCQTDPLAREVVDRNQDLAETVWQVAREAVTNAAKHGRARSVKVAVGVSDDGHFLSFSAVDDGTRVSADELRGGGSRLFDAVSENWTRQSGDTGTELELSIPLPVPLQVAQLR